MPAAHAVHVDAPETSLKVPGRQSTHAEGEEEPWFGLQVPAAHAVHVNEPETSLKVPGRQSTHAEGEEEPSFGL